MDQLIEVIRRLISIGLWLGGVGFGVGTIIVGVDGGNSGIVFFGVGIVVLTWIASKILNWIFLR